MIAWTLFAASLFQQTVPVVPDFRQLRVFATLEREPAWEDVTRIRIGTFGGMTFEHQQADGDLAYWFLREVEDDEERVTGKAWTSSALCPAALPVLRRLETLPMPHPDVPGYKKNFDVVVGDGVSHRLRGVSRHADGQPGNYSVESNNGTPLSDWSDALSHALDGCWRSLDRPG